MTTVDKPIRLSPAPRKRKPRVWAPVLIPDDVTEVTDPTGRIYRRSATVNAWWPLDGDGNPITGAWISTPSLVGYYGPLTEVIGS